MAYDIRKTNGTSLGTILDGTVDNKAKTSLVLIGRNYANYGQFMVDNLVSLVENFAYSIAPTNPLAGQLWWNTTDSRLRVYTGTAFKPLASIVSQPAAPNTTVSGDVWWDSSNEQLYVYNGATPYDANGWILVGPGYSKFNGKTGAIWEQITDTTSSVHNVVSLYLDGVRTAIISRDSEFTPQPAITGYATVKQGLTGNLSVNNAQYFVTANNANFLDNIDSTQFLRSDENDSTSGMLSITNNGGLTVGAGVGTGNLQLVSNTLGDAHIVSTKLNTNLRLFANVDGVSTNALSIEGATGETVVRELTISENTIATSSTTGALKVVGGVGVLGDVYIDGDLVATELTGNVTGTADMVRSIVPIALGGTDATNSPQARTNLGLTIGTDVQAYNVNLQAISQLGANGIYVRTSNGQLSVRQLVAGNNITIANATAVAGNPSISLSTSPALAGEPTAPTPPEEDDSTRIATTEWVRDLVEDYGLVYWAGFTSPDNAQATFAGFPVGTVIVLREDRSYTQGTGNGGLVTVNSSVVYAFIKIGTGNSWIRF
jgi:hypothetical protein